MRIQEVLDHFNGCVSNGPGRWKVLCPAHADGKPSLAIALGENGHICFHCHAGCPVESIVERAGLSMGDLFDSGSSGHIRSRVKELSPETRKLRHEAYSTLLAHCPCELLEQSMLAQRGMTIGNWGYGTLNRSGALRAIKELREKIGVDRLLTVPGFVRDTTGAIRLVLDHGLLIPVRSTAGEIIAIQVRTEDEDGKYKWLSSQEASSGSPCHVPLSVSWKRESSVIRITEGPLKADVACCLQPEVLTIGIPGTSTWAVCLPVLQQITSPTSEVRIALDSDWQTKAPVKLALNELYRKLSEEGYKVSVEVWDEADGKGIDDLLLAGKLPKLVGEEEIKPSLEEEFPEHEGIILLNAARIQEKPVEWFWNQWLPYGAFCTLDGDPNEGKSTIVAALCSHNTGGVALPGHLHPQYPPTRCVVLACEDDKNNTWKPRLMAAGVDCSLVEFWDGNRDKADRRWLPNLPADMRKLEYIIRSLGVGLVVIDPLFSYVDAKFDSYKDQHMKLVLNELADLANRTRSCILGIRHLNKSIALGSLYRGSGSTGIVGVARAALMVVRDEEDDSLRYLAQVKGNLTQLQPPWKFRIDSEGGRSKITWLGQDERSLRELSKGEKSPMMAHAAQFLVNILQDQDMPCVSVYKAAQAVGIKEKSLDRAKKSLGIKSYQSEGQWYWRFPNDK